MFAYCYEYWASKIIKNVVFLLNVTVFATCQFHNGILLKRITAGESSNMVNFSIHFHHFHVVKSHNHAKALFKLGREFYASKNNLELNKRCLTGTKNSQGRVPKGIKSYFKTKSYFSNFENGRSPDQESASRCFLQRNLGCILLKVNESWYRSTDLTKSFSQMIEPIFTFLNQ